MQEVGDERGARHAIAIVVAVVAVLAGVALPGASTPAAAATCSLVPQLRAVTVNQGLGYTTLARGKDTLVRLFLSLPSCAASGNTIALTGASLTLKNGATTLGTINTPVPAPTAPYPFVAPYSSAPVVDSTGDPKFLVPGSMLAPAGTTAGFTATFTATVSYQSQTSSRATPVPGSVTFSTLSGSTAPITAAVAQRSNALRVLAVPMGDASQGFSDTANTAVQNGFTALSRVYPVPAGVGSLLQTDGGIRYSMNAGMLDLRSVGGQNLLPNGTFCGTSANFDALKAPLAQFLQSWNTANPSLTADRVMGVVDGARSQGASNGCAEGMAAVGSTQSWVRAINASPSTTGALMSMELAHTLGDVPTNRDDDFNPYHSPNVNADVPLTNRTYNLTQRAYLAGAKTALTLSSTWNEVNALLEGADYAYLLCQLGGPAGGGCTAPGTVGTATGVGAAPVFVLSLSTDGTAGGTHVVESYFAPGPPSGLDPTSQYRLVQKQGSSVLRSDGVLATVTESLHSDGGPPPTTQVALISAAVPFNTAANRIELYKGSTLLYARDRAAAPSVSGTDATSGCSEICPGAGQLDPSFGSGGTEFIVTQPPLLLDANAVVAQDDGKIVLGGVEITPGGIPTKWTLVRLNGDGTVDHSFEPGGQRVTTSFSNPAHADVLRALALQPDGKIVGAGTACPDNVTCLVAVARYKTDGTLDTSFGTGGKVTVGISTNDQANAVALQSDGKIVVAGSTFDGNGYDFEVIRLNADGSFDDSFGGGDGIVTFDYGGVSDIAHGVALQADGKIVVVGTTSDGATVTNDRMAVARLNADGTLDTGFGDFLNPDDQSQGRTGKTTTDFSPFGEQSAQGHAVAIDSTSGRIVVGGRAFDAQGASSLAVAAFTSGGDLDQIFDGSGLWTDDGTIAANGTADGITGLAIDSNGSVIASGDTNKPSASDSDFVVLRLVDNGALDSGFGDPNQFGDGRLGYTTTDFGSTTDHGRALALQPDGRIVVAGGDGSRMDIARYLAEDATEGQPTVTATVTAASPAAAQNLAGELRLACPQSGGGVVHYILDVGVTPDSVSGNTAQMSFPYTGGAPCPGGTLEVVATDGFTPSTVTGGATTSPPDATQHPPVAAIAYPLDGSSLLESSDIALRGSGNDEEDGVLSGSSLSWSITGPASRNGTGSTLDLTLPPGDYTATLTATDSGGANDSKSVSFHVLADADHDGIPATVETATQTGCGPAQPSGYNPDNDGTNAYADYDGDGIPNVSDPAPCQPATAYDASVDFNPDTLNTGSGGQAVTIYVRLPYRDLRQLTASSVKITAIRGEPTSIANTGVTITGTPGVDQVATVKVDRSALIAYLKSKSITNERVPITVSGSASAGWSFSGTDTTFVTK